MLKLLEMRKWTCYAVVVVAAAVQLILLRERFLEGAAIGIDHGEILERNWKLDGF